MCREMVRVIQRTREEETLVAALQGNAVEDGTEGYPLRQSDAQGRRPLQICTGAYHDDAQYSGVEAQNV